MSVHSSNLIGHLQTSPSISTVIASPAQYTLITDFSVGTNTDAVTYGYEFRVGNLPSGNTAIINYPEEAAVSYPGGQLINVVKDSAPILVNGSTWEFVSTCFDPTIFTFYNVCYKTLNSPGNPFFPNLCNSTTVAYASGYTTVLTGPTTGAYKIMSIYVKNGEQNLSNYQVFITNGTFNSPPTNPVPYLKVTSTNGLMEEMTKGQKFYLTSGQNLVFNSDVTTAIVVTVTYALVT